MLEPCDGSLFKANAATYHARFLGWKEAERPLTYPELNKLDMATKLEGELTYPILNI